MLVAEMLTNDIAIAQIERSTSEEDPLPFSKEASTAIQDVPDRILIDIFLFVDPITLFRCKCVNRRFYNLIDKEAKMLPRLKIHGAWLYDTSSYEHRRFPVHASGASWLSIALACSCLRAFLNHVDIEHTAIIDLKNVQTWLKLDELEDFFGACNLNKLSVLQLMNASLNNVSREWFQQVLRPFNALSAIYFENISGPLQNGVQLEEIVIHLLDNGCSLRTLSIKDNSLRFLVTDGLISALRKCTTALRMLEFHGCDVRALAETMCEFFIHVNTVPRDDKLDVYLHKYGQRFSGKSLEKCLHKAFYGEIEVMPLQWGNVIKCNKVWLSLTS